MNNVAKTKMRQMFPGAPEWLLNDEGLRQEFTEIAIRQNRWLGFVHADTKALKEFGYSDFAEYWNDLLSVPMKSSSFIELFSFHLDDNWMTGTKRPGPARAIEKALDLARDMNEPWFFDGARMKSLMLHPRAAAEWLMSMTRYRHLVPTTLMPVLRGEQPQPLPLVDDSLIPSSRGRGRPPDRSEDIAAKMLSVIEGGVMSASDLQNMKQEALPGRFGGKRTTCVKVRKQVLSKIVTNS